jgi:hypothetical protein
MLERRNIGLLEAGAVTLYLPLSVGAHKLLEFRPGRCRLNRAHALPIFFAWHELSSRGLGGPNLKFCLDSIMQCVAFVLGELFRLGRYWVHKRQERGTCNGARGPR